MAMIAGETIVVDGAEQVVEALPPPTLSLEQEAVAAMRSGTISTGTLRMILRRSLDTVLESTDKAGEIEPGALMLEAEHVIAAFFSAGKHKSNVVVVDTPTEVEKWLSDGEERARASTKEIMGRLRALDKTEDDDFSSISAAITIMDISEASRALMTVPQQTAAAEIIKYGNII